MYYALELYCFHRLKFEEGFRGEIYKCPKGFDTIGYGHKIMPDEYDKYKNGITMEEAEELLRNDMDIRWKQARMIPEWKNAPDYVKAVLFDMVYQMGFYGTMRFKETRRLIAQGKYEEAGEELMDSDYARTDSPNRAARNRDILKSGNLVVYWKE